MSRKTRSGTSRRMAVTASRPFLQAPITSTSGSCLSRMRIPSRASGSSSTISARIFPTLLSLRFNFDDRFSMKRKCGGDYQTAFLGVAHFEAAAGAIKILESRTRIRKADPLYQFSARNVSPRTVVAHLKTEHAVLVFGANIDHSPSFAVRDPVPNGVFNQGLKKELRDQRV